MTGLRLGKAILASGARESVASLSHRGGGVAFATGCGRLLRAASSPTIASQPFHTLGPAGDAAERLSLIHI